MKPTILILGKDASQCNGIADLLAQNGFLPQVKNNFSALKKHPLAPEIAAIILDIDAMAPDNHLFRRFKRHNPGVILLGMSNRPFHPELRESMEKHIFACANKPVDPDEILFLLKSGCDTNGDV